MSLFDIGDPVEWISPASGQVVDGVVTRLFLPTGEQYRAMLLGSADGRDRRGSEHVLSEVDLAPAGTHAALDAFDGALRWAADHATDEGEKTLGWALGALLVAVDAVRDDPARRRTVEAVARRFAAR